MRRLLLLAATLALATGCGSFANLDELTWQEERADAEGAADASGDTRLTADSGETDADDAVLDVPNDAPDASDMDTSDVPPDAPDTGDTPDGADLGEDTGDCPHCETRLFAGVGATSVCALVEGALHCWGNNQSAQLADPQRKLFKDGPSPVDIANVSDVSAGDHHTCAVADGDVFCWGENGDSQLGVPTRTGSTPRSLNLALATQVAAGGKHTCAIAGGSLWCWGDNLRGQTGEPRAPGDPVVQRTPAIVSRSDGTRDIAAGGAFTCMIASNDRVACFGDNTYLQLGGQGTDGCPTGGECSASGFGVATTGIPRRVTAGREHACVTTSTGGYCWGNNRSQQLTRGGGARTDTPVDIGWMIPEFNRLAAGGAHTCAVEAAGYAGCWGNNTQGQVGVVLPGPVETPQRVALTPPVRSVVAGLVHSCAIADDNDSVFCWGDNSLLQLAAVGPGGPEVRRTVQADAQQLAAGAGHTCARLSDGSLQCWGDNTRGQLGDGVPLERPEPFAVPTERQFTEVGVGSHHACGLDDTGTVFCWGHGPDGQLGQPQAQWTPIPAEVSIDTPVRQIAVGAEFTCATTTADKLYCWGLGVCGQLGNGQATSASLPQEIDGSWTRVAAGWDHACAIDTEDRVHCWGVNTFGQVGQLGADHTCHTDAHASPVEVSLSATDLALGRSHSCAITNDASVLCWGLGASGQLGVDPIPDGGWTIQPLLTGLQATRITAGEAHTCAVNETGTVLCWGQSDGGRLGLVPDTPGCEGNCQLTPQRVPGLLGMSDIAAGRAFTCAAGPDGLRCWGNNREGQLGLGDFEGRSQPTAVTIP